jgi:beta-lactam-binding protein with PASTA domain
MSIKHYLKNLLKTKPVLSTIVLAFFSLILFAYLSLLFLKVYTHHNQAIAVPDYKGMTYKEYVSATKKKNLRCEIIDSMYIPNARPGSVIEQYPAAGNKVKQHRTIYLTIASQTPEKVSVPKVTDVGLREAQSRLENIGLKVGQVIYRPSEFYNLVLDQRFQNRTISKGELIPKGTAIDLVVGRGLGDEKTELPILTGMSLTEARSSLYYNNLTTGALVFDNTVVTSYDSMTARVWKQSPVPETGSLIGQGTSVDLWFTLDDAKLNPPTEEETIDDSGEF